MTIQSAPVSSSIVIVARAIACPRSQSPESNAGRPQQCCAVGTTTSAPLQFFAQPVNAVLMASFVIISLYHAAMGVQVVIDDYIHSAGTKIALFLLVRLFVIATGSACLIALLRISVF